jgi:ATP-dependent Clp protease adaptor protein ClpS
MQKKMNTTNNAVLLEMLKKQSNNPRGKHQVILHNDSKNTFDHVIACLMDICGHNELQAYQCALIVHTAKQCSVAVDTYEECLTISTYLKKLGLSTSIEKYKK